MPDYNTMAMVDPRGRLYDTEGKSHPDWCHDNRRLVGFVPVYDEDEGEDSSVDEEGRIALDYFKDEGWTRVKPDAGVEVSGLHEGNLSLIKAVLRSIAKDNPGRTLYVDDGDGSKHVFVDFRGRPDFSQIEERVTRDKHRYGG